MIWSCSWASEKLIRIWVDLNCINETSIIRIWVSELEFELMKQMQQYRLYDKKEKAKNSKIKKTQQNKQI